ncbi:Nitrate transport permease protein nrtB [Proteiniborus sp. DW1]|uniref:ABC transporter permease n=1 Tax=Proteiniborus sp. DW1 TaxID=1889883 RepID=UPI00092DF838|nr:Nitrate transport permease protein nrtB [Proteiniborus sp. DW1]
MKIINFIKKRLGIIIIFIGIIITYVLLTDVFGVLDPFLFKSITTIPPLFKEYLPQLIEGFKSSMSLLVISFLLALVVGISLGAFLGTRNLARKNLTPFINAFSAIPVTLLTPYAINILPSFRAASMFIIFLGCFWIILGTTISAVMTIDKRYLENASTLEITKAERLFRIILPAASPSILAGCTIALKFSFTLLAVAEMFGATSGMGYFIQYYSDFGRFDLVAVGFLFMAMVLVIILYLFDLIKSRILYWTINN